MINIVTWNIQCGKGADGVLDLDRIARVIGAMADADVICLQEVARHDPELDGGAGADQLAFLAARFFQHEAYFAAAIDRAGPSRSRRRQFGNVLLSRLPMLELRAQPLPQPAGPGIKHMRRIAIEAVVAAPGGPLRVTTTHLEYHSAAHRAAQVEALRALHEEACANTAAPPLDQGQGPYRFVPRPPAAVVCGDFNFGPEDAEYARMTGAFGAGIPALRDAWTIRHVTAAHDPTCGIFDREQWKQGPHCRDFFFVSDVIAGRVKDIAVDTKTNASDHQPVLLVLDV